MDLAIPKPPVNIFYRAVIVAGICLGLVAFLFHAALLLELSARVNHSEAAVDFLRMETKSLRDQLSRESASAKTWQQKAEAASWRAQRWEADLSLLRRDWEREREQRLRLELIVGEIEMGPPPRETAVTESSRRRTGPPME